MRCEDGDPFQMLLAQVESLIISWIEGGVNWLIDSVNHWLDKIPFVGPNSIGRFCWPDHPHDPAHACSAVDQTAAERAAWLRCENADLAGGLDMLVRPLAHRH